MSYLLWRRDASVAIASGRRVLRAAEVPLLQEADRLCDRLSTLLASETVRVEAAAREASDAARMEGFEAGRREGAKQVADTLVGIEVEAARDRELLRAEVAALAIEVVRKIAAGVAPDAMLAALAETATRDMLPATTAVLAVHPDRCDAVRARLAEIAGDAQNTRWNVVGDADCDADTCRIETEYGSVDASLEAQLGRLAAAWSASRRGQSL